MLLHTSLVRGDVVLAPFSFADFSATKHRPAAIVGINPAYAEFTLAFVTSQRTNIVSADEVLILPSHPEFSLTGFSVASKLRAGKLITVAPSLLTRRLGRLGPLLSADLDRALVDALSIDQLPLQRESQLRERKHLTAAYENGGLAALFAALGLPPPAP